MLNEKEILRKIFPKNTDKNNLDIRSSTLLELKRLKKEDEEKYFHTINTHTLGNVLNAEGMVVWEWMTSYCIWDNNGWVVAYTSHCNGSNQ